MRIITLRKIPDRPDRPLPVSARRPCRRPLAARPSGEFPRRQLGERRHAAGGKRATARRGSWSSPAAPAAGRAFSRSIAGSCSSPRARPPGAATTWSAGAIRCACNGWAPDGRWYGDMPRVLVDVKGAAAEALIPKVQAAIEDYRYRNDGDYRMWPGPNSNTFIAAVLRAVPELATTLPPNAIGKDFRDGLYAGLTDSGTGVEASLFGAARRQGRLGRRHRAQSARPGRRARPAPSGGEAAWLRPHRHR